MQVEAQDHDEQGVQLSSESPSTSITTKPDANKAPANEELTNERRRLLGFTLQLLHEFLSAHALERTAESLRHELEAAASSLAAASSTANAELWFDMQQRCRSVLSSRGGKPMRASSASTLEQLVAFVVELPALRAGGRFALDVGVSARSPLTVFASPKTSAFDGGVSAKKKRALQLGGEGAASSFTLMDAYAQTRSPVELPSQRRRQQQQQQASTPLPPSSETPTTMESEASEPAAAPSEPDDHVASDERDDEEVSTTDGNDEHPPSTNLDSKSNNSEANMTAARSFKTAASVTFAEQQQSSAPSSPSLKQRLQVRKKKRRPHHASSHGHARHSPLPSPAYPRSPWGNVALHANKHFAAGSTARVHADFDAPIRRSNDAAAPQSLQAPESALVRALDATLQRDLGSVRLVDRELRHLRLEKIRSDSTGTVGASGGEEDAYERALMLEKFGSTKRVECALCAFPFLLYNLPHRVSFKCVMDVHDAWGFAPTDRATAAKYRPPLCYDAVRVCRMCAPIVLQHATKGGSLDDGPPLSESRSVGSLPSHRRKPRSRGAALAPSSSPSSASFCSDPYALPPLFANDLMDERDAFGHDRGYGGGYGGAGINGGGSNGSGFANCGGGMLESPAKTIVYANQTDATAFMSAKEWEVINPHRSSIRQVMEKTVHMPSSSKHEH